MESRCQSFRSFLSCFVIVGVFSSAIVEGNPDRRWSVRKTGEFGRRLDSLPKELQLPNRQFRLHELNLELSETRRYDQVQTPNVRKPSVDLELPYYNFLSPDQEAQETEDSSGGYVYAKPEGGYDITPSPVANYRPDELDPTEASPEYPDPQSPDAVAGLFTPLKQEPVDPSPIARETDIDIDSQGLGPNRKPPKSSSPHVVGIPTDKDNKCTDDNDPNCWTHDYTDVIPGVAGTDYPILSEIVDTNFNCDEQEYSGYYADFDEAARCQVFHICLKRHNYRKTQKWSFLCPNGTIFSQRELVCVLWPDAECDAVTVRSLYNVNQELGWDNVTEITGNKIGSQNGELQTAMSAFRAASNSAKFAKENQHSPQRAGGLPYRVPVKVNEEEGRARTKLQEVTKNALHGTAYELDYGDNTEHDVEESSNFETSLRKQSEAQRKTKSGSALYKSISEAYELKGTADGVQPFIVNRPHSAETVYPPADDGEYEGESVQQTERPQVVMMPTRQRLPDGSESYAEVPVMLPHGSNNEEENSGAEGYSYPRPSERFTTPAPTYLPPTITTQRPDTTTEDFSPPTIPTEPPLDHENYETEYQNSDVASATENNEENGYHYPNPSTTERYENSFDLPQQQTDKLSANRNNEYQEQQNTDDVGYRYTPPTTTESSDSRYQYPQQNPTGAEEEGYNYPNPTSTEAVPTEDGYQYPNPASTEGSSSDEEGYRYTNPTTAKLSSRLTNAAQTTEQTTETDTGYQYPSPDENHEFGQRTTTESSISQYQNEQYQFTDNEVSGGYDTEPTTRPSTPERNQALTDTTDKLILTTTTSPDIEMPAGGYLPPANSAPLENYDTNDDSKHVELDEDTVGISGADNSDYDEEYNEVATGPTGQPDGESSGGYGGYPTPPSSTPEVLKGGGLGTYSQLYITTIRQEYKRIRKVAGSYYNENNNGHVDSDEKVNEILKQVQNGGIEAVDSSGKPIEFDRLKELLLSSPPGSFDVRDGLNTPTSLPTESPTSPQTEQPQQPATQQQEDQHNTPLYHTVTTASVLPPINNNNNAFSTATNTLTATSPDPSSFYLSQNNDNNNNFHTFNTQQQHYSTNNNNPNILVQQPTYEIKLPNREFENHSVSANTVDNNNNRNPPFYTTVQNQYQSPQTNTNQAQNLHYEVERQPTPQQQFFPSQNFQSNSNPTLATSLVIPQENYLPPAPSKEPSRDYVTSNAVIPSTQSYQQQQQPQGVRTSTHDSIVQQPHGEYLPPPRQASSSILQSQYYNGEASPTSSQSIPRQLVSRPIQLTENIQLQQSFAQPLSLPEKGHQNPLVNPKDIKIVPALFVHQHTSVASQIENELNSGKINNNGNGNVFQNLDTAQSIHPADTSSASKFGTRDYLAQQLNQLANSVYSSSNSEVGRQFYRRSNTGASSSTSSRGRGRSSSSAEPSHTIEKAQQVTTFTLEDARTPEELQQYHHQDLKRFHSENIAKLGGVLEESHRSPPPSRSVQPNLQHRFETQISNNDKRIVHGNGADNQRNGRRGSSSSRNNSDRFSHDTSTSSGGNRGRSNNEEYFIPISASYGGGGSSGGRGGSTRNSNNNNGSQFRVSGRSGSGRSYSDSESEHTLLKRFLPEEEGGFGSRLL